MKHLNDMLRAYDNETARILSSQVMDESHSHYGAFVRRAYSMDTRSSGLRWRICWCPTSRPRAAFIWMRK